MLFLFLLLFFIVFKGFSGGAAFGISVESFDFYFDVWTSDLFFFLFAAHVTGVDGGPVNVAVVIVLVKSH